MFIAEIVSAVTQAQGAAASARYVDSRGQVFRALPFRVALEQVLTLAAANGIQPIDIAFGDAALADQQIWEAAAVQTVSDFLAGHAATLDALEPPIKAGDWPDAIWLAERSMDPRALPDAICIVLAMAESVAIEIIGSVEQADLADAQQLAFDVTRDLLGLHRQVLTLQAGTVQR